MDAVGLDGLAADEMLLDDFLKHLRGTGSIPNALGVNHRNRAIHAKPEAICLGPRNAPWSAEPQFVQSPLKIVPRGQSLVSSAAFGLGLIGADKDMPLDLVDVKAACKSAEFRIGGNR